MTQQDVLKILKKQKKWMTAKEIAGFLGTNFGSVTKNLNGLYKYYEVNRKWAEKKGRVGGQPPRLWKAK